LCFEIVSYSYAYEILYRRAPRTFRLIYFVKAKRPNTVPLEMPRYESLTATSIVDNIIKSSLTRRELFKVGCFLAKWLMKE